MFRLCILASIAIFSLTIQSCSKCPKDKKLGNLQLTQATKNQFPYQAGQTLTLVSDNGDVKQLKVPKSKELNTEFPITIEITCESGDGFNRDYSKDYLDAETIYGWMPEDKNQQDFVVTIVGKMVNHNEDIPGLADTLFYEFVQTEVKIQAGEKIAFVSQIIPTSDRGNTAKLPASSERLWRSQNRFIGDTTLMDRPFTDVTLTGNMAIDKARIYVSKQKGIVGIQTEDVFWVLDKIE